MLKTEVEERLVGLLTWGALVTTLLITDRISSDPVNVGKMLVISVLAGSILCLVFPYLRSNFSANRYTIVLAFSFIFAGFVSIVISSSPVERGFFGAFGRNTGLLTYVSLVLILLGAVSLKRIQSYIRVIRFFVIAGTANVVYCLYALDGRDFIKWVNPYGKPIGTFGNPNFISSFMGIFITVMIALLISRSTKSINRILCLLLSIAALYVIILSGSLQGLIVSIVGVGIVGFFFMRSFFRQTWITLTYLITAGAATTIGILGTLQIGFLAPYLYKPSVSIRGEYWQAGLNMWQKNPFFGVGMDSYGLFYRTLRDPSALEFPGVNTVTDAAHNVFIDILSGVGFMGFTAYIGIVILVLNSAWHHFRSSREYDPIFVALFGAWVTYQIQSVISINQIGLAIWGWLFGGLLIGYASLNKNEKSTKELSIFTRGKARGKNSDANKQTLSAGLSLLSLAGATIGFMLALPPFLADAKFRNVMSGSVTAEAISSAALNWPQDNLRMNKAMVELANNGKTLEAEALAAKAVLKFPHDYPALWVLYNLTPDEAPQKAVYKLKLHELDPFNPEFAPK